MKKLLVLPLALLALASCGGGASSSSTSVEEETPTVTVDLTGYTVQDLPIYSTYSIGGYTPSKGDTPVLVVPIEFSGDITYEQSNLDLIETAFTDEDLDTQGAFHSLREYYRLSSYGKLDFQVTITDVVDISYTPRQIENMGLMNGINTIMDEIKAAIESRYEDLTVFDSDSDGRIDAIDVIYLNSRPLLNQGGSQLWWNYTTLPTRGNDLRYEADVESPVPHLFFYSAYSSLDNGVYGNLPDTHTLIHETGHMLGAPDYYSGTGGEAPTGGSDMMDLNVGDHSAFTKMLYGWVNPMVPNADYEGDSFEITLRPFESSGDVLLLRNMDENPYNDTPFDEYLTLSYYTPTGLNEMDSKGYSERSYMGEGRIYDEAGLLVYHVDNRAVGYEIGSDGRYTDLGYVDDPKSETRSQGTYAFSNTGANCVDVEASAAQGQFMYGSEFRQMEVIPSTGRDLFPATGSDISAYAHFGDNDVLFQEGDYFDQMGFENVFPRGDAFNDGSVSPYCFEVLSMDQNGITLRVY